MGAASSHPHTRLPGCATVGRNHPRFNLRSPKSLWRAFGGDSASHAWPGNACLACTEDKCNHYQVFFAVKNYLRICDVNVPS